MSTETLVIPKQRERVTNRDWRRGNANIALSYFAGDTVIVEGEHGHLLISWTVKPTEPAIFKRWQVRRGQDFYPVWSHKWGHGGTCCTALSQLVRWIRGMPVLPMSTWRYWAGEKCRLAGDDGAKLIERLVHAQYPEHAHCVLCGEQLRSLDWWNLNGVSGPCCDMRTGCKQRGAAQ